MQIKQTRYKTPSIVAVFLYIKVNIINNIACVNSLLLMLVFVIYFYRVIFTRNINYLQRNKAREHA